MYPIVVARSGKAGNNQRASLPPNADIYVANFVAASSQYFRKLAVPGTPAWTISIWYKPTNVDSYEGLFWLTNGWDNPTNVGLYRYLNGNGNNVTLRGHISNTVPTGFDVNLPGFSPGTFVHIILTFDGSNISIIKDDGTPVATAFIGTPYTAPATLYIGQNGNANYVNGLITRVGWWNVALSNDIITSLYNTGVPKQYTDLTDTEKANLISYYNFSTDGSDSLNINNLANINGVTFVIGF